MTQWYYMGETGIWWPCSAWLAADLACSDTGPNGAHPVRLGEGIEHKAKAKG